MSSVIAAPELITTAATDLGKIRFDAERSAHGRCGLDNKHGRQHGTASDPFVVDCGPTRLSVVDYCRPPRRFV
jgi:hypothetical protein